MEPTDEDKGEGEAPAPRRSAVASVLAHASLGLGLLLGTASAATRGDLLPEAPTATPARTHPRPPRSIDGPALNPWFWLADDSSLVTRTHGVRMAARRSIAC